MFNVVEDILQELNTDGCLPNRRNIPKALHYIKFTMNIRIIFSLVFIDDPIYIKFDKNYKFLFLLNFWPPPSPSHDGRTLWNKKILFIVDFFFD